VTFDVFEGDASDGARCCGEEQFFNGNSENVDDESGVQQEKARKQDPRGPENEHSDEIGIVTVPQDSRQPESGWSLRPALVLKKN
jgi:hypothetical protein